MMSCAVVARYVPMDGEQIAAQALSEARGGRVRCIFAAEPLTMRRALASVARRSRPSPTLVSLLLWRLGTLQQAVDVIVEGLAEAAVSVWPDWYAGVGERFDRARFPRAEVELRLEDARARCGAISATWFRQAWGRCRRGLAPRVAGVPQAREARQLAFAIDPQGPRLVLTVVAPKGTPGQRHALARVAEWAAAQARAPVLLLAPLTWAGDAALDPVSSDALLSQAAELSAEDRHLSTNRGPTVLVEPAIGKPHGGSVVEARLQHWLLQDAELSALFAFNQQINLSPLHTPRVDLLWEAGRLVIELDGEEHHARVHYAEDRERDFQLLVNDYSVVRFTNDRVLHDTERVIEQIRQAVRYCRKQRNP